MQEMQSAERNTGSDLELSKPCRELSHCGAATTFSLHVFPITYCLSLQCQWSFWEVLEVSSSARLLCHKRWFSDFAGFSVLRWGGKCIGVHLWEDVLRQTWGTWSWAHTGTPALRGNESILLCCHVTQSWGRIPFFTVTTKADQYTPVGYWCRMVKRILKIFSDTATIHNRNFSLHAEVSFLISTMSLLAVWFLPVKVMPLKALI